MLGSLLLAMVGLKMLKHVACFDVVCDYRGLVGYLVYVLCLPVWVL